MIRQCRRLVVVVATSGFACAHSPPAGPEARQPTEVGASDTSSQSTTNADADPGGTQSDTPRSGTFVLDVDGFEPAVVSLPARSVAREPLLVAVHGAGDGPEWECSIWREILGERGVILCPAGKRLDRAGSGHYHPDHHALERLLLASVDAIFRAMPDRLDTAGSIVYAAYSQGATMGALMIVRHAARYSRLILVEGGHSEWNVSRGRAFKSGGGQRVLFACGTRHCGDRARRSATWLEKAGVATRVVVEPTAGHTYAGAVGERVRETFDWLVEGDQRWMPVPF